MLKRNTPLRSRGLKPSGLVSGSLKSGGLKKSGIKSQGGIKRSNNGNKNQFAEDLAFYERIWNKRPHICESCGERLGEFSHWFFDHLAEKGPHPEFRYEEENIALVCIQCHHLRNMGFPTEKHLMAIEKAKKKFL